MGNIKREKLLHSSLIFKEFFVNFVVSANLLPLSLHAEGADNNGSRAENITFTCMCVRLISINLSRLTFGSHPCRGKL